MALHLPFRKKPEEVQIPYIQCPFCGQSFKATEVKFRFVIGDDRHIRYFSGDPAKSSGKQLQEFCQEGGYECTIRTNQGIPVEMVLKNQQEVLRSPFRVCANDSCNQVLSAHAGFYASGNGIYFLGERSSGKTVMLTTLVEALKERAVHFSSELIPYNENVKDEYKKNYYQVLYKEKRMPKATVAYNNMAFEWVKYTGDGNAKIAELNFSDIRGEDTDNAMKLFNGHSGKMIQSARGFLLAVDLIQAVRDQENREKILQVFHNVLENAVVSGKNEKYLAIVLTKSDLLVNRYNSPILMRNQETVSPAYQQLDYKKRPFELTGREEIQKGVRELLAERFPQLILKAESVFASGHVGYFAVSALGSAPTGERLGTEGPVPIRVEEPVLWILEKMGMLSD